MESGLQYRYQASWASILEVIKVTFEVNLAYNKIFHVVSCFMCLFPKPVQSQSQQAISKKRIKSCLFGICEKQSETVKSVEHFKNDYHEPSEQVSKDWLNGEFDAKWQEKEVHK